MSVETTTPKKKGRAGKIALIVIAAVVVLLLAALAFVGNYFYEFALDPNNENGFGSAAGIADNEYTRWLLAQSSDQYLESEDGLALHP